MWSLWPVPASVRLKTALHLEFGALNSLPTRYPSNSGPSLGSCLARGSYNFRKRSLCRSRCEDGGVL